MVKKSNIETVREIATEKKKTKYKNAKTVEEI